jgi:hypothetical protein
MTIHNLSLPDISHIAATLERNVARSGSIKLQSRYMEAIASQAVHLARALGEDGKGYTVYQNKGTLFVLLCLSGC